MPTIKATTGGFNISPEGVKGDHIGSVALELGVLACDKSFADVTIHCKNQVNFKVNLTLLFFYIQDYLALYYCMAKGKSRKMPA